MDELIDRSSDLIVAILKLSVNFLGEVSKIVSEVQDDTDFVARSHSDHQKTLKSSDDLFLPQPLVSVATLAPPARGGEFQRHPMNLKCELKAQLVHSQITILADA